MRQMASDPFGGFNEVDGVAVVFFNTRCDCKNVRIKDDVFGGESHLLGQKPVRPGADRFAAFKRIGLPLFVKGHDNHGRAVLAAKRCLPQELVLSFFHGDGVHDGLALHALQAGLNHAPLRRVDHDRHPGDVGFRGDEIQESNHGCLGIKHGLVHVHVNHLGPVFDLLTGHRDGLFELPGQNKPCKLFRPGYVGPFANIDEKRAFINVACFKAREP